jgi:prepilin-type N-terminal cleavage/methylation domain-containing protein
MALRFLHPPADSPADSTSGFTLLETLVTIAILGILIAILAPAWNGFLSTRNLSSAQDQLFQTVRQAQVQALKNHQTWQASFQEANGIIQYAVHELNGTPTWQTSIPSIHIDGSETTLATSGNGYRVQFNRIGQVNGKLGRLTLVADNSRSKRCIVVSTLMGLLRKGHDRTQPDPTGRYCY